MIKKVIWIFALLGFLTFYQLSSINVNKIQKSENFLFSDSILNGIKKYYASILWVKIDEFYHLESEFRHDIKKQTGMLELLNKLDKTNIQGAVYLSIMYSKYLKDYGKAIEVLNEFIKNNPKHEHIHKILGEIGFVYTVYVKDYKKAESALYAALQSSANDKNSDGILSFHFPLNYLKLLRFIAQENKEKEKYEFYDKAVKKFFQQEEKTELNKMILGHSKIYNHEHSHDEHHHHNHMFSMSFPWQNDFIQNKNIIIIFFLAFVIMLIKFIRHLCRLKELL
ncbi:MAG: hypothetical protein WC337_03165 [Candidatus Muiribacteriota bacterium]